MLWLRGGKGYVFALLLAGGVWMYRSGSTETPLSHLADAVMTMQGRLPGHYRVSVGALRIQKDHNLGCWAVGAWVAPEVEVFYTDDGVLQHKQLPASQWAEWLSHQKDAKIWLSERALERGRKRMYTVLEVASAWSEKNEVYLRLDDSECVYHEAQRVSFYGAMSSDVLHSLLLAASEDRP